MPQAVRIDTLRRAARLLGGVEALARKLGVSPRQLEAWMDVDGAVPADIFLRTVDLIEESLPGDGSAADDAQAGQR